LHFAAPCVHSRQPDWSQRDGQVIPLAEPFHTEIQLLGTAHDTLAQPDGLQVIDVGTQRLLGARTAIEVVEEEWG
jgi:hypothetical protein